MYCVFWGTGAEHLRTLLIPLIKAVTRSFFGRSWLFMAIKHVESSHFLNDLLGTAAYSNLF